ncbi:hypothetical protein FSP39_018567 [Pinctada imbricata]|uniref:Uncharacterized protein n=1 Tax=Pinctada imbricata TaxID=66713 RepID=A0AA89C0E2_PINIB|nr:hypothetical protein FSP39_018567 [Pinctada imbricata]
MSRTVTQTAKSPPVALPPKPRRDHWSARIQETVVSAVPDDSLGIVLSGGADNGQFCYINDINKSHLTYHSGKLNLDELILEVQGQKIAGYTLRDATLWLKQVSQNGAPVMIKTVKIGLLPKDLRQFLSARFQKGSVDHDLQQTIRDNLYLRTVPCTTRGPRPGEVNGVDYTFLSVEEFFQLEKSGSLLESGLYDGNHYGTPKPPSEPKGQIIRRSSSMGGVLPAAHGPERDSKRRRNRSNTEGGSAKTSPVPFTEERGRKKSLERAHGENHQGSLPDNWEMAYTEAGIPYFIDHNTETTHWLDPRQAHTKKPKAQDCDDDELPFGWEKVEDPHYGTYYIDHVNRRTQYENPVAQAKRTGGDVNSTLPRTKKGQDSAKRSPSESDMSGRGAPPGGDHTDEEFLQIKKVVENGPAHHDGTLKTGDVLVYVDDRCVLGYSHQDIVNLFQTIPANQAVTLTVCRGYMLPFDPDDPNTEIIVTVAVTLPSGSNTNHSPPSYSFHQENTANSNTDHLNTSAKSLKSLPDLTKNSNSNGMLQRNLGNHINSKETPDVLEKPETHSINIVRGEMGFGFTIADSAYGQKVKQILDKPRCKTLQEGDILQEINHVNVREMSHSEIVQVLKQCPQEMESAIVVQRGGIPQKVKRLLKTAKTNDMTTVSDTSFGSSNPPGQYFFDAGDHHHPGNRMDGLDHGTRPKTPTAADPRSKTPSFTERPKTPTRTAGHVINDTRGKPPVANRPPVSEMQNMRVSNDTNVPRREYIPHDDFSNQELNLSKGSSEFHPAYDINSRPPPGPRYDQFRQDFGHRPYGRQDTAPNLRQNQMNNSPYNNDRDRYDSNRDSAKPGMFRSRTPGPEMLGRGPDHKNDFQRPKTPTAQEMRSKTPLPGHSYGYNNSEFMQGRYQNSSIYMNGPRQPPSVPQKPWTRGHSDYPTSPPPLRRDNFETFDRNNMNNFSHGGAGRLQKHGSSFDELDGNSRVSNRFPLHIAQSPRLPPRFPEEPVHTKEFSVTLQKQDTGFGFRIIGGTEEGSQVSVGHIVPNGAADMDGRIRTGDEITHVDNICVVNSSHHRVVTLMGIAGNNGRVTLGLRRRVLSGADSGYNSVCHTESFPYDVTVTRSETEGFGFVIISSVSKTGSVLGESIGRIIENSPAERCGRLHIGDRILAVNGVDISHMHHEDIVNLIKDSGYSVTLTVGPPQDDASSTTSNSQKNSHGSMVNAMAYPMGENEVRRNPPPIPGDRNFKDFNRQRSLPNHQGSDESLIMTVELPRGARGFGFSIRGGQEFNCMPLFVLRIAEGGSADLDGRLRVGDQILEINGYKTETMTHSDAIDIIQNGGQTVRLLVKRTGKLPPAFEGHPPPVSNRYPQQTMPMSNGPIGQSSPYLGRRNMEPRDDPQFYKYQANRSYPNY